MMLRAESVSFEYARRSVLDDVTLSLREGELLGLVGPNGAGKSTLFRCLHGELTPRAGAVLLDERELGAWSRREIARVLALVPQQCEIAFPVPVRHFVGLGRFAREPFLAGPSDADRAVVERCLAELGLEELADRGVDQLSGGEFRRVLVAQALAQEPRVLLFDEPVQQLDLLHQLEVMEFARSFTRRGGTSAAVVLHDLGLAARYCDRLVLLHLGRVVAQGAPRDVLTAERLREVWCVDAAIEPSRAVGSFHVTALAPARTGEPEPLSNHEESR